MKIKGANDMKKFLLVLFAVLTIMCFSACDNTPVIEKYYLDTSGNLIAEFEDGSMKDLGTLGDTIANGVEDIEINADGYYVINDIVTDIQAKLPESYAIDKNGNLIVTYTDTTTENLGKFGNDSINTIDTISISDDGFYVLNGIKTSIVAIEVYDVTFDTGFSTNIPKQTIKDGYKVKRPEIERTGYTLNGWYCNGEEWRFNSDIVKSDMVLTADWTANEYTVSFDTGIDSTESPITITYDGVYVLPELEQVGYTFDGWLYKGTLVTASKWNIAESCTLTAKWTVNKYIISLNANGGNVSPASKKVEYGKPFTLPVATNSYGAFIGWLYNGEQITDSNGNSLSNWAYTTDIEVTTSWTIEVSTIEDLQQLYTYPNGHFELKNNLDISLIEWTPIGTETRPFTGQIDGGNFIISGLKITQLQENLKYYGFIGYANSGKIFDLTFTNVNINLPAISNTTYIGAVIGANESASIENVKTFGNIELANHSSSNQSYVGGFIGYSCTDYIKSSINAINITAKNYAGGFIGYKGITTETDKFINNKNTGNISAEIAGGLIGDGVLCFAEKCYNTGNITGVRFAGGIVGRSGNGFVSIRQSINSGAISLESDSVQTYDSVGGLIGFISDWNSKLNPLIINSYNTGAITGTNYAGGILGATRAYITVVQNCYNNATVKGNHFVAGIAGYTVGETSIEQCINFGKISCESMTGTIAGYSTFIIENCYYNCSTNGIDLIQGTKTTENYSAIFYTEQLFWDSAIWNFHTDKLPTLKFESVFNN